jgi:hypothetical protein
MFEYADSIEELARAAAREDEVFLKQTLALIGFVLGALMTYGLVDRYTPDWPKILRFGSFVAGSCVSAFISASVAVWLRASFVIGFTVSVLAGVAYLLWRAVVGERCA